MRSRDGTSAAPTGDGRSAGFPGERQTTAGRFSGVDDRLVHVAPDGSLQDFGYPLSGLVGIRTARFGLAAESVQWFDAHPSEQTYVGNSYLVETVHRTPVGTVRQLDLTEGSAHVTRFELAEPRDDVEIVAEIAFAPEGRELQAGRLTFRDAVEVFHDREHDYLASGTGIALRSHGSGAEDDRRQEDGSLGGRVAVTVPFAGGATTMVSLLTDAQSVDRAAAGERLDELLDRYRNRDELERRARQQLPDGLPADLGVLRLLSAENGLRIAAPDFDPEFRWSGGYGYTWFRDDAEIANYLLDLEEAERIDLGEWHRRSARMYCRTQLPDGSWPHRVWPRDGALAPGWANGWIEAGELLGGNGGSPTAGHLLDYQADQTASTVRFLARLRPRLSDGDLADAVDRSIERGTASLDATLDADGRPVACQNAWEDDAGRFAHTAATFLGAYAAVGTLVDEAAGPDGRSIDHAIERAEQVYRGIDDLWIPDTECYARRETPAGDLDNRLDSSTFALVGAHRAYADVGTVEDGRIDRLTRHVHTAIDGLYRSPSASEVAGLVRYQGDEWRRGDQATEKIWTVSTVWGANAAAELALLLRERGDGRAESVARQADELMGLVSNGGPLCEDSGFLPEQYFDDGRPDSATPLGWSHALRAATRSRMDAHGLADVELTAAED